MATTYGMQEEQVKPQNGAEQRRYEDKRKPVNHNGTTGTTYEGMKRILA